MRRKLALALLLAGFLPLTGCVGVPQSRESGHTAVVSLLAAREAGAQLEITAAAEGRGEEAPLLFRGRGETPAAAIFDLEDQGRQVVDRAHVEHFLLAADSLQRLPELLSYAFLESQQSTETLLWVVRGEAPEGLFAGDEDLAQRMNVLKTAAQDHQGFASVTLREAAAVLAEGSSLLLPALERGEDGVAFWGYALYRGGGFAGWLTGDAALGACLLKGENLCWTASQRGQAMDLQSRGCGVTPVFEGERLTGLKLLCRVEGMATGGWDSAPEDRQRFQAQIQSQLETALEELQTLGWDGADLLRRAGLKAPRRWEELRGQWERAFPTLKTQVEVRLTVAEQY